MPNLKIIGTPFFEEKNSWLCKHSEGHIWICPTSCGDNSAKGSLALYEKIKNKYPNMKQVFVGLYSSFPVEEMHDMGFTHIDGDEIKKTKHTHYGKSWFKYSI